MANKQAEEPKQLIVDTRTKAQIANRRTSQSDRGRVTTEVTEVVVTRSKVQSGSLVIGERRYVNAYVRNFLYFRIPRDPLEACVIYGSYRSALAIVYVRVRVDQGSIPLYTAVGVFDVYSAVVPSPLPPATC